MKRTDNTNTRVERDEFKLDFTNTPFVVKPDYEIELATNGRKALIYSTTERSISPDRTRWEDIVPAWRVVLVTKKGSVVDSRAMRYDSEIGKVFTDPLMLHLFIRQVSMEFNRMKRTTTETTDIDE